MKRVYIAVALLSVITFLCIGAIWLEQRQLGALMKQTDTIETSFREGNLEKTARLTKELADSFPQKTKPFTLFLHHNVLKEVQLSIHLLPIYLEKGEEADFLAELERCRILMEQQLKMEVPTWDTVF